MSHRGMPVCALTLVGLESDFDDGRLPALRDALARATARLADVITQRVGDAA